MCKTATNKTCQRCETRISQTKQVPLPLAACVAFSGLRYHCQFHTLKTAMQISLTSDQDWFVVGWVFSL